MIIIYHLNNKVVEVVREQEKLDFTNESISNVLIKIAAANPEHLLIWCHVDLKQNLNLSHIEEIFHHKKIMASYNSFTNSFLPEAVGYVEDSPFIKINKKISYPTWQMSSCVGGIHALTLTEVQKSVPASDNFDYFLHSTAKLNMINGLFCYSEPLLIQSSYNKIANKKASMFDLFLFVKQHYKTRWLLILLLNLLVYEKKTAFWPFLFSLFYRRRKLLDNDLDKINVESKKQVVFSGKIDVIIPTIGRKKYLYDVLKDLSVQSQLPLNVIIVEQNPNLDSVSELNYIFNEKWPFKIKHTFTRQSGACNARNIALSQVESEWVFLNDDDNRFESDLLEKVLYSLKKFGIKSLSTSYLQKNELKRNFVEFQSPIFGSGNSFIQSSLLSDIKFNMQFEFGYGEDADFGMQLRNLGTDVIYFPNLEILHLKAPMGGFRNKPVLAWNHDEVQPKPSPTVMLNKQLHLTKQQINGYKTILFFKFYKLQKIKNPFRYFLTFEKQWKQSLYWANKLINK